MLQSLALIFIVGLFLSFLCSVLKLPRIIGLLITGIVLGPHILNLIGKNIIDIAPDLKEIALIIILLKAGFSLNIDDLKKVGRPAVMLSFVPATFEIIGYTIFASIIFNISVVEAALMGAVLAAVSPAVVVPRMVNFIENGYGTNKRIPQMIMAGASCDDIFVIVLFTTFLHMLQGKGVSIMSFANIPISIVMGVILGVIFGYGLYILFETSYVKKHYVRNSMKVIIILAVSFLLTSIEVWLDGKIAVSSLIAVVSMAAMLKIKSISSISQRLSEKFGKLWLAAEVMLFVLVGTAVDIKYTLEAGISVVLIIFIALIFRSIGVLVCLIKTDLNIREKVFCVIAYLPKATVQAAIGSVALSAGLSCGRIILSVAVMAILITAPLGAICIDAAYKKCLNKTD